MPTRSELADGAELAEILKMATNAAAKWTRGRDEGDTSAQADASKLFDAAKMRLRRLTRGTAR
jgi:hypothetical protein